MKPKDDEQRCAFCRTEVSEPGECDDLIVLVSKLFDVQPDVTTARIEIPDGTSFSGKDLYKYIPIYSYSLGTKRPHVHKDASHTVYLNAILGMFQERFQRVFGESYTGRKLWWRERPNGFSQYSFDSRATYYAIWFAAAIENLTDAERAGLSYVPEGECISYEHFEPPQEPL
jgi:hypothetical protein